MKALNLALYNFWSQFGLKAFESGRVPAEAEFPYITFFVGECAPFSSTILTAHVWYKEIQKENMHEQLLGIVDKIKKKIPPQGERIIMPNGMIVISPNDADFIIEIDDGVDRDVKGMRISYQVNYYYI